MTLEFFLDGKIPAGTHQMKKVCVVGGKPRFYEPVNLKAAREYYMARLKEYAPKEPFEGAVQLRTEWHYKPPKNHKNEFYKITAPDTDNLVKMLKDCMTKCGYWNDDAQVAFETIVKYYDPEREGIFIRVSIIEK